MPTGSQMGVYPKNHNKNELGFSKKVVPIQSNNIFHIRARSVEAGIGYGGAIG